MSHKQAPPALLAPPCPLFCCPLLTPTPSSGGNPDSNTLISDMTTVICLDDYHCLDRTGRSKAGVTALDPKAQAFDLMYNQVGLVFLVKALAALSVA